MWQSTPTSRYSDILLHSEAHGQLLWDEKTAGQEISSNSVLQILTLPLCTVWVFWIRPLWTWVWRLGRRMYWGSCLCIRVISWRCIRGSKHYLRIRYWKNSATLFIRNYQGGFFSFKRKICHSLDVYLVSAALVPSNERPAWQTDLKSDVSVGATTWHRQSPCHVVAN